MWYKVSADVPGGRDVITCHAKKDNEWYTPAPHIKAAWQVMGGIDLDPASCALANETVRATRYYTQEDDGLLLPWYGRVWLNPPYGEEGAPRAMYGGQKKRTARMWIQKLIDEYKNGNITQAILLTKADPKERWFQPLWEYPICFADRVYFNRPNRKPERNQFGTAFTYLGPNEAKYIEVFSQFGTIARRVSPPQPKLQPELWSTLALLTGTDEGDDTNDCITA